MRYGLELITAPEFEPLRVEEARKQVRIFTSDHDDELAQLIQDARNEAEKATDRQICTATWELTLDRFPRSGDPIYLPKGRLQEVTSIQYNVDGEFVTWDEENYVVSASREPGRIVPAFGKFWPIARAEADAVKVRYVCGWTSQDAVPGLLKRAMLLCIGTWWVYREDASLPERALSAFRRFAIGDEFHQYSGCREAV